jgi:hypothetical protein
MKQLQTIWTGLSEAFTAIFSQPVSLPFSGFVLLIFVRCVRRACALLIQGR